MTKLKPMWIDRDKLDADSNSPGWTHVAHGLYRGSDEYGGGNPLPAGCEPYYRMLLTYNDYNEKCYVIQARNRS